MVRFRPGTPGEAVASEMAAAAKRARKKLVGLGSEPWGVMPQICLVDPFPDPHNPRELITSGTVVDATRGEIWMVVTSESPPEAPERPMALLFGASLPAAQELSLLLEGYGLYVAGSPDPDPEIRQIQLPPLAAMDGELRTRAALSFVRWLIARSGASDFLKFLSTSRPGGLEDVASGIYGAQLTALEESWRRSLAAGPSNVRTGQFLKLAARYLRPHLRREIEVFGYMLLGLAFTIVFPFGFRRLIDVAIPSGQFSQVLTLIGVLGAVFLLSLVAGLRRTYLSAYVSGSVVRQIRSEMFARIQALSAGWFNAHQEGDIIARFSSDALQLEAGLSQALRDGLFQFLSLVVSATVMVVLNPLLAVIVLVGAPVIGLVYKAMSKEARKRSMAVQEQTGALLGLVGENYNAQPVVRAFGLAAREIARFRRATDLLFARQVRLQLFGGIFGLSVNVIVTLLRLVVLGFGAWLILQGNLTIGGLVAFTSIMGEVLSPVAILTSIGQQVQASTGALVRINEVLDERPAVADGPGAVSVGPPTTEIRLSGVGFSYTPERRTLESIDAVIPAGSRVAFVGPTGAGKSSVLQLLLRFYEPDEGAILFDGTDIRDATLESLRRQIGVVFQETFLFTTTIRENLALANPNAGGEEIEEAAKAAELHDFIMSLPGGYETLVGERGGRLSGGQRQRLAIARALLRDPAVLLLDEATSALDPRTERAISRTLDRVGEGRTTIAVSHRLQSIAQYDRIFVLVEGRLKEQGTHEELLLLGGVYADLWAEQTGAAPRVEPPFDAVGALSRVPIFRALGRDELELAASRLRAQDLAPGERIPEGGGRLVLIRRGRARVLVPDFTGALGPAAELGSGDAFGVAALLGRESGAVLEATEALSILLLDDQALAGLAAGIPAVRAALEGAPESRLRPVGGQQLSRSIIRPSVQMPVQPVADVPQPDPDAARRLTGSMPPTG